MILDKENLFSEAQGFTDTAASTNYVDLGADGTGVPTSFKDANILCQIITKPATCTTIAFAIQTDDNTSFSSATVLYTTPAIAIATLVAGYQVPLPKLPDVGVERYVRLYYTVVGTTEDTGTVTAGFILDKQTGV